MLLFICKIVCTRTISFSVSLVTKPKIYRKYAINDNSIVWFGSINLLAMGVEES